jgi:pyrroline-5-carboxylate reductase
MAAFGPPPGLPAAPSEKRRHFGQTTHEAFFPKMIVGVAAPGSTGDTAAATQPSTAKWLSPTGINPPEPAACDLFAALGTVFAVESENEFDAICAVAATIAAYFAFIERIGSWLAQHGIPESNARDYIARMFWGLTASAVDAPERSFQSLAGNHATAGGINEQFLRYLIEHGLLTNVSEALEAVLSRTSAPSQSSDVGTAY